MLLSANLVFMSIIAISFGIFIAILYHILFVPISKIIEKREEYFAKNTKTQTMLTEKAQSLIEYKETTIKNARAKASNLLKETNKQAKIDSENRISNAKKEVAQKTIENQEKLSQEQLEAKNEMKTEISYIVNSIATKILNEDIDIKIEEENIKKHLNI